MKKTLRSVLLALLLVIPFAGHAQETLTPQKRAEIEKLLELTGAMALGQQMSDVMVIELTNALKATRPDLPQRALDFLPQEVNAVIAENIGSFKELVVAIYDRHYSLEEIRGLNEFYASPLGRKVTGSLSSVMQESVAAGQTWGESLGPEIARRIQQRLKSEGIAL